MTELPSGTVTFLFTDIEGSTKLAQEYPDAMPALLARHHEILNQVIHTHNGHVFQRVGDSFAAAFHSPSDALHAALDGQRKLHSEAWAPAPIKVRMGLHTAASQLNDASAPTVYSGYANLALAQRIMSAGHGGQILLSAATRELVRDTLPTDSELIDLGEKRLKDLSHPELLYQLNALGLPSSFPPLKTLDSFLNNLPIQLTSFVGREHEIAEVKQELNEHRLVTLTGSGGTGKTRLSLQVAADLLDHFSNGIWFVELATLAEPDLIPQAILSAIGLSEKASRSPLELLKEYLHDKKSLIVLDNCEHLIEGCATVVNTLLSTSPELKILASSREALGVKGELTYPVPSLSLPDIKHLPGTEQLSRYEAVRLFLDRASLVSPHFQVDKENAPAIAQICYRLDGIPLAIELAAARVKMMTVEQISKRLDDRFRLLTGGARTALPRQQTLRALIDWSYDLLSEKERLLLRRLSVFAGSWTLEAAEEVCAGQNDIGSYDILDLLTQLVNKSLVAVMGPSQGGETRYRMLETIRQYAREKLLESGEGERIRDHHLDYYMKMAEQAKSEGFGPREMFWLVWLDHEWDNLRAAVEWSMERRPEAGLELVNCLGYLFLSNLNNLSDIQNWLAQLLSHPANSARTTARARGLLHRAWYASSTHEDIAEIPSRIDESMSIYEETGDRNGLAHGHLVTALTVDDLRTGSAHFEKAITLFRKTGDKIWAGFALLYFGWLIESHDYDRKRASLEESLALHRELGYVSGMIESLKQLGALELRLGDFESAHCRLDEAVSLWQAHASQLGNSITMGYDLGDLAFYEGDYELAQKYYEECLAWADQKYLSAPASWAKVRLGYLSTRRGERINARRYLRDALTAFHQSGVRIGVIFTLEGFATLAVAAGQWEKATLLFSCTAKLREDISDTRPPVEQASVERDLAILHSKLAESEFASLSAQGRAMDLESAVKVALEE
jgi:predicted ATPase/class 3 adenylate cyclase